MPSKEGAFGRQGSGSFPRQTSGASGPFGRQISTATSSCLYADAAQTLLFLDWDDTLFPTTALFQTWGLRRDFPARGLPEGLGGLLEDWGAALKDFLAAACAMSERCIIVTNSKRPWVQTCIEHFAPAAGLLDAAGEWTIGQSRLSVVYALEVAATKRRTSRSSMRPVLNEAILEEEVTEHLMKAKQVSMQQEAKDFYSKYPGQTWKNLLSIGDMRYEHVALQEVTFRRVGNERERLRTKAITVPTSPSMGQISARLRCMRHLLYTCVHVDGDLSIDLEGVEEPLQKLGAAFGIPEITRLTPLHYAWKEDSAPSNEELTAALADLARLVQKKALLDF